MISAVLVVGVMNKDAINHQIFDQHHNIPVQTANNNTTAVQNMAPAAPLPAPEKLTFTPVTVNGRQIMRDGKQYIIHGVTLSTAHPGENRQNVRMTLDYIGGQAALQQMREMGINSIRTYNPPTEDLLDALANNGMTVTVGFAYFDDRQKFVPDNEIFDIQSGSYLQYINRYKNHPAVLQWEFGNEYNLHPEWFDKNVGNWYAILHNAVRQAQSLDANHPATTSQSADPKVAEWGGLNAVAGQDSGKTAGLTVYRGNGIGNLANDWKNISGKPVYLAEFGVNYSADQNVQARDIKLIWQDVQHGIDQGILSGGYLMTWQSENWKNGIKEQNLGVKNSDGSLRLAYYQMRNIWANGPAVNIPASAQLPGQVATTPSVKKPVDRQPGQRQINFAPIKGGTRTVLSQNNGHRVTEVTTRDLREVNKTSVTTSVYDGVKGHKPVEGLRILYPQQEKVIMDAQGLHGLYSLSMDIKAEPGVTITIGNQQIQHVSGVYFFQPDKGSKTNGISLFVSLRDLKKNDGYQSILRSTYVDLGKEQDETGHVKLPTRCRLHLPGKIL